MKTVGYKVLAPAWPRLYGDVEDIRRDPSDLANLGVLEIADHFERILNSLNETPFLIGHCFGGLIMRILMDRGFGAAGVAINAPTPKGILRLSRSGSRARPNARQGRHGSAPDPLPKKMGRPRAARKRCHRKRVEIAPRSRTTVGSISTHRSLALSENEEL